MLGFLLPIAATMLHWKKYEYLFIWNLFKMLKPALVKSKIQFVKKLIANN